jgi:hypothetical protein
MSWCVLSVITEGSAISGGQRAAAAVGCGEVHLILM